MLPRGLLSQSYGYNERLLRNFEGTPNVLPRNFQRILRTFYGNPKELSRNSKDATKENFFQNLTEPLNLPTNNKRIRGTTLLGHIKRLLYHYFCLLVYSSRDYHVVSELSIQTTSIVVILQKWHIK